MSSQVQNNHSSITTVGNIAERFAHAGLETTAGIANFLGKSILITGIFAVPLLAIDADSVVRDNTPYHGGSWTYAKCGNISTPLYFWTQPKTTCSEISENSNLLRSAISTQYLLSTALIPATILSTYACHKVAALANRINKSF